MNIDVKETPMIAANAQKTNCAVLLLVGSNDMKRMNASGAKATTDQNGEPYTFSPNSGSITLCRYFEAANDASWVVIKENMAKETMPVSATPLPI